VQPNRRAPNRAVADKQIEHAPALEPAICLALYAGSKGTRPTHPARRRSRAISLRSRPAFSPMCNRPVITTRACIQFRDWIVARASRARECSVWNATGGGILHGGTILQTTFGDLTLPAVPDVEQLSVRIAAVETVRPADLSTRVGEALMSPAALPLSEWLEGGDNCGADAVRHGRLRQLHERVCPALKLRRPSNSRDVSRSASCTILHGQDH
jgi:hypothetical protein